MSDWITKAVNWPNTNHPLWWMYQKGGQPDLVYQDEAGDVERCRDKVRFFGIYKDSIDARFIPAYVQACPDLPPPLGPWDYEPKPGDWVYVKHPSRRSVCQVHLVESIEGDLVVLGKRMPILKGSGYRFAKADVPDPPPFTDNLTET